MSDRKVLLGHREGVVILPYSTVLKDMIYEHSGAVDYPFALDYVFYVFSLYESVELVYRALSEESFSDSEIRAAKYLLAVLQSAKHAGYGTLRIRFRYYKD